MLMLARFCNKYQSTKTGAKYGLCNCLGAVEINLNKRLDKEEIKVPRVDSGQGCLNMEHESDIPVTPKTMDTAESALPFKHIQ